MFNKSTRDRFSVGTTVYGKPFHRLGYELSACYGKVIKPTFDRVTVKWENPLAAISEITNLDRLKVIPEDELTTVNWWAC